MAAPQEQQQQQNVHADGAGGTPLVPITSRVHARIGVLGNPSDGFYGKTISLSLENFFAEVRLCMPNPLAACRVPRSPACHFTWHGEHWDG